MAQYSFPWTSTNSDRTITSNQARALNKSMVGNGVLEAFAGSITGDTLSVTAGAAMIEGAYYNVNDGVSVSLVGRSSGDVLVARYDLTARSIVLAVITGAPTRSGGVWELPLATLTKTGGVWDTLAFAYEWALLPGAAPVGSYTTVAGDTAPNGFLVANGAAVSRTVYARLFAAIGTTYGAGNGSTTFNLPDVRGRVLAGYSASDADFNAPGKTGGAKTHTLTTAQIPSHTHLLDLAGTASSGSGTNAARGSGTIYPNYAQTGVGSGGGQAHNNLQPYLTGLVCIRA